MSILDPFKRVERLRKAQPKRAQEPNLQDRIPPGQYRTEKFPVLTNGPTPQIDLKTWRLKVFGLVEEEFELTWREFTALPTKTVKADIHCVTRWSQLDMVWEGVPFVELLQRIKPNPIFWHPWARSVPMPGQPESMLRCPWTNMCFWPISIMGRR